MKRIVLALALLFSTAAPASAYMDNDYGINREEGLSTTEQIALVVRLSEQIDKLPVVQGPYTNYELGRWADEILPYFEYENLTTVIQRPLSITFEMFTTPMRTFHVLGTANCMFGPGEVNLNGRMTNPHSTWYQREDTVWTLTHELIHIQGGPFCTGPSEQLESNTQIATTEILAAMVNSGNTAVLRTFLTGVRDMGLDALEYSLPADAFMDLYDQVIHDPLEHARLERSLRHWASDPAALADILYKYNVIPWEAILTGLKSGGIERVQVPKFDPAPMAFDDAKYLLGYPTLENLVNEVAGDG